MRKTLRDFSPGLSTKKKKGRGIDLFTPGVERGLVIN